MCLYTLLGILLTGFLISFMNVETETDMYLTRFYSHLSMTSRLSKVSSSNPFNDVLFVVFVFFLLLEVPFYIFMS